MPKKKPHTNTKSTPRKKQQPTHTRKNSAAKHSSASSAFISTTFILSCFFFAFIAVGVGRGHIKVPNVLVDLFPGLARLQADPDDQFKTEAKTTADVPVPTTNFVPRSCENDLWLSQNGSVVGYHVLCVTPNKTHPNSRIITYYRGGNQENPASFNFASKKIKKLRRRLEKRLGIQRTDKRRSAISNVRDKFLPWRMYTTDILNIQRIDEHFYGTILVFEGGQWIWPTIRIGYLRNVSVGNRRLEMETLSTHPAVFLVKEFMSDKECDQIVRVAAPTMAPSTVTHMHNTEGSANQWRTSETTWLRSETALERDLQMRTADLTGIPASHQEAAQVLRYQKGQQYDSHWDYFDPDLYKGTATEESIRGNTNRLATVFWYLSDVALGGWTYFPRFGLRPTPESFKLKKMSDCQDGLLIQPVKGATAIFYSLLPNGEVDPLSLHGACPVGEGQTKWAANKWVWNRPISYNG